MDACQRATVAVTVALPIVASASVAGRFASRHAHKVRLAVDDWTIGFCLILAIINSIFGAYTAIKGFEVTASTNNVSRQKRLMVGMFLYTNYMFCIIIFGGVKMSILMFYKRIFSTKRFLKISNIMIGVVLVWMVICFGILIISMKRWSKCVSLLSNEKCTEKFVRRFKLSIVNAIVDMVLDAIILLMPIPVINRLKISNRKRAFLTLNFLLGAFCLVAVVVRIYYNVVISMIDLSVTSYQEYLAIREQSYLWARIEANVSIVAACLPTLGPLIGKWAGIKSPFASTMNENKIENDFPSPVIIPSTF